MIPAKKFMNIVKTVGIVDPEAFIQKKRIIGSYRNGDIVIDEGSDNRQPTTKNLRPSIN